MNSFKKKAITPVGLYESNYRKLLKCFPSYSEIYLNLTLDNKSSDSKFSKKNLNGDEDNKVFYCQELRLEVIENFKYTSIVKLFRKLPINSSIPSITMMLRLCHDASVAEVISFQGSSNINKYYTYPNKEMFLIDEKKQLNYHVRDILDMGISSMQEQKVCSVC